MKYTIKEFAEEIRNQYPGDYEDLSDKKLVNLWLKKYPGDTKKIDFNDIEPQSPIKERQYTDEATNSQFSFTGIVTNLILAILFGIPISYYFQPEKVRGLYTLVEYIKSIPDLASSEKGDFISPIFFSVIGCFVVFTIIGRFLKN